jgi:hypothetical protein
MASVSGRTSTGTARDTASVSTQSWGPIAGCYTPAWLPWAADDRLCARGSTGRSSHTYGMVHMFWVSLVDNFQILIALYFNM